MALLTQDVPYPAKFPTVEIAGFMRHFFPVEFPSTHVPLGWRQAIRMRVCLTSTIMLPASNVSQDTSATCRRQTLGLPAAKSHFQDLPKCHPSSVTSFTRSLHRTRSPSNAFSLKHTMSLFCPQTTHPSCLPRKSLAVTVPYPPSPFIFLTSPFPGGPIRYS